MKLLTSSDQAVFSFKPNAQFIQAYKAAPYNRRWVIRMNAGNEYVTVRTVSSVRAGFMRGRGSIAWVVVPYGKGKQGSKVFGPFEFLSSLLNGLFKSSSLFSNNHGALAPSKLKVNSMRWRMGLNATTSARLIHGKRS